MVSSNGIGITKSVSHVMIYVSHVSWSHGTRISLLNQSRTPCVPCVPYKMNYTRAHTRTHARTRPRTCATNQNPHGTRDTWDTDVDFIEQSGPWAGVADAGDIERGSSTHTKILESESDNEKSSR